MPAPNLGALSDLGSNRQEDTSPGSRPPSVSAEVGGHILPSSVNAGKLSYGLSIVAGRRTTRKLFRARSRLGGSFTRQVTINALVVIDMVLPSSDMEGEDTSPPR